jgi:integrase/recombinase XerD
MSALGDVLDEYLALRRAVGFTLVWPGRILSDFVAFVDARGESTITVTAALEWAAGCSSAARALEAVRVFARYVEAIDPATEVPDVALLPRRTVRPTPYLYSEPEVAALMAAARALEPELWAATCETVVGLLWATGLRIGEVLRLDRSDVSLEEGLVTVWHSKFKKSRHVALAPSAAEALARYDGLRNQRIACGNTEAFFVTKTGRRLNYPSIYNEFVALLRQVGIPAQAGRPRPRLHDLRHSFAVRTLLGWYRSGEDVGALLPRLSTYLGHIEPATTYWYLSAAPELMALAAERLEQAEARP